MLRNLSLLYSTLSSNSFTLFGNLNGSHSNEDALISDAPSNIVYDPYDLNEGLGEKFTANYLEVDLITSINLERVYEYYSPRYRYYNNNDFDIYCNIGGVHGHLWSTSMDHTCKVWSLSRQHLLHSISFPTYVTSVVTDLEERKVYVGGGDGKLTYLLGMIKGDRYLEPHYKKNKVLGYG